MIKGIYLNEMTDDCTEPLRIQKEVFGSDIDNNSSDTDMKEVDFPVVHILLCEEDGTPVGSARLFFSMDGIFKFDRLCVYKNKRNNGYADFIMHMLFDKCRFSGGEYLYSDDIVHNREFFEKYGFENKEKGMILNVNEYYSNHKCAGHE